VTRCTRRGADAGNHATGIARAGITLNSDVVDQPGFAEPDGGEQSNGAILGRSDRSKRHRVPGFEIIEGKSGEIEFDPTDIQDAIHLFTTFDTRGAAF